MNNRQAGRRRGRGTQRQPGTGGGNSRDNGNRIDNRARGNAAQLLEKYKNLAADAQRAGDRVNTEYYLQFADHYFRVLEAGRSRVEEQRRARDDFDGADDEDFDLDENEAGNDRGNQRDDRPREDRGNRDDRQPRAQRDDRYVRDDRQPREDRGQREERQARDDRAPREDRQPREERQARDDRAPRDDRQPREERQSREERAPREERQPRERLRRDGGRMQQPATDSGERRGVEGEVGTQQAEQQIDVAPVAEPAPVPVAAEATEAKPVRRRTPRARAEAAPASVEEAAPSIEADRLPPALSAGDDAADRPRRRRRVRTEEEAAPPVA
ncbi:hypothetical protein ASE73_04540 [Sphingomonas sp. Leaf24]|uniref:DUF4167 domain-containing protein n=1 Tax=unclassified Sphingomonas TaxID=196159 RepID=UPI0006F9A351|nr:MULTISPECIES: DUF4167 domain-containing protein [unclassified Sphingomonas]KQM20021.1 hypothetical protein ASE50_04175 [Sphingomonas sp. Leaf5]KQM90799.1 hypothetical protein ASE73_04540 [Sphingomonas sp. Leaf24]